MFLGTAGAEGDLAYRLTVEPGRSRVAEVPAKRRAAIYEGRDYQAFTERVLPSRRGRTKVAPVTTCRDYQAFTERVLQRLAEDDDPAVAAELKRFLEEPRFAFPRRPKPADAQALFAPLAKPDDVEESSLAAFDAIKKLPREAVVRPLVAASRSGGQPEARARRCSDSLAADAADRLPTSSPTGRAS